MEFWSLLRQIAATGNYRHMILNTSIRGKGIRVIFNSSTQRNFISLETIR
jgi:hypothetical protein